MPRVGEIRQEIGGWAVVHLGKEGGGGEEGRKSEAEREWDQMRSDRSMIRSDLRTRSNQNKLTWQG